MDKEKINSVGKQMIAAMKECLVKNAPIIFGEAIVIITGSLCYVYERHL